MNKSSFFTGQPIFTQLIKLIPKGVVAAAVQAHQSDRYCKKFDTFHHLITMLYVCFQHCSSLREVVSGMGACEGRLQSLGMRHLPARSTFSEANFRRSFEVFEQIYLALYHSYKQDLPDSRADKFFKKLLIIDSTTISLFREILKGAGSRGLNGKKKGGIKVHMAVRALEDVPYFVRFSPAASADVSFLKEVPLPQNSIVVLDRAYNSYRKFFEWHQAGITWITRLRSDSVVEVLKDLPLTQHHSQAGVICDQLIRLGFKNNTIQQVEARLVRYYDTNSERIFTFLTNNTGWDPIQIAQLYKQRWQIELLFKRLKQNMPLQYFLGDNENAIKIQIYCALIADLLLKVITRGIKRKWAFSNLASLVRLHLMNYTDLRRFLEHPDRCKIYNPIPSQHLQLQLALSG